MPCEASRICNPLAGAPLTDIFGKLTSRAINPIKYLGLLAGASCKGAQLGILSVLRFSGELSAMQQSKTFTSCLTEGMWHL
jgi:hypothetical protein